MTTAIASKFNLAKEVEKTKFVLAKKDVSPAIRAQVAANIDVSGSMKGLFSSGIVQRVFQTVLPVGLVFDDNGEVDVFTFADGANIAHVQPCATATNFADYVDRSILRNSSVPKWGSTSFAPVIEENLKAFGFYETKRGFFGGAKTALRALSESKYPVVIYMFTDGENDDKGATTRLLQSLQDAKVQIYFLFIGVGTATSFDYLKQIGDQFGNTGFLAIPDVNAFADDEDATAQLVPDELCTWLKR